ncbi:MAG: molybdopterin biosynthesis protein, partial [Candidatus Bathyarchaeota archaeon]
EKCGGRILGEDVEAPIDVPPFDRAAMDGYAVNAQDTYSAEEDNPIHLKIVDKIEAGEQPHTTVQFGEAIEISTGAPIPKGANAIVMVEHTWQIDSIVQVFRAVIPGENISAAGSDIMAGELVLRSGILLTQRETGILAALGITRVKAIKKPVVAIISTGNEIITPGESLTYGKIYDINARTIADSVSENGGIPKFWGIVRDNAEEITMIISTAIQTADMVVTSGGTSAGIGDLLYRVIDELGNPGIIVHGVAAKPGKPLIIAVVKGKPIFGLPGYPTSALTMFNLFVRPLLRQSAGLAPSEKKIIQAKSAQRIFSSGGRREYLPVNLIQNNNQEFRVYPTPGGSGSITTLAEADGFILIPETRAFIELEETVDVELFSLNLKPADLMIIGSHCIGIDLLLHLMRLNGYDFNYKVINTGSTGGLVAIRRGEADIAGIHLLDEMTGKYNLPFLHRFEIEDTAFLIRGYKREQGLIITKENPHNILGINDVLREDISIINRNPGSGTRVLFDRQLQQIANEQQTSFENLIRKINGYTVEAKSHTAVATSILHKRADVGLAIRPVATRYNLDFLPIAEEHFDFLINRTRFEKPSVQTFLETLRSKEFTAVLREQANGFLPLSDTGTQIYPSNG